MRNGVAHDARVLRSASVLRNLGHRVEIIGSVTRTNPDRSELVDGVPVTRLRAGSPLGLLARRGRLPGPLARLHRALTALDWQRRALTRLVRVRPGLIHANDFNTMAGALLAKRLFGARVIYDAHELWADRNGRPEWRWGLILREWRFVRRADAVMTASPGYARVIASQYGVAPPTVIRNIPAVAAAVVVRPALREAVYVGGLMPGRGLEVAISALRHAPEVTLRLVGFGRPEYERELVEHATQAGVADRVHLAGAVPPDAVVVTIATSGFGLCLIEPICRSYELTLPNKLFECALAGLPLLASELPVLGAIVREAGIGEVVDPADAVMVGSAMRRLANEAHNAELRDAVARFARAEAWAGEAERLRAIYVEAIRAP